MLEKINQLTARQVAGVFVVIALVVFFTGLGNPFQGDDSTQIVANLPVHFIQNIGHFFVSSTFYDGGALVGTYYRPLMTTTFSLIYTFFGEWTVAYHAAQLALFTGAAFLVYLLLKHFIKKTVIALPLALIFLVHPLNSQIVFSIPCMQDALMLFFGMLSLWLLVRYDSTKSLFAVAFCLLLTMFSKESGLGFVAVAFIYLFLFDRNRTWDLLRIMVLPFLLYFTLKTQAVGLFIANAHSAPIGQLDVTGRLLTAPSIAAFYFFKFLFPATLATGWYWIHPTVSIEGTLVPLLIDFAVVGLFIYLGMRVRRRLKPVLFKTYALFAIWSLIGLIPYLQLTPLDMTACETWFAFSMIAMLAMIGISLQTFKLPRRIKPLWIVYAVIAIIIAFGIRTAIRGTDYSSQFDLAQKDLAVSKQNYGVMNNISQGLLEQKKYKDAIIYAKLSIDIQPNVTNYNNLGVAYHQLGDYPAAIDAYNKALQYGSMAVIYENLGQIHLASWNSPETEVFFDKALKKYPKNNKLWIYYSIVKAAKGNNSDAKLAITNAGKYGQVPEALYVAIMKNQPLSFSIPTSKEPIKIP